MKKIIHKSKDFDVNEGIHKKKEFRRDREWFQFQKNEPREIEKMQRDLQK